MPIDVPRSLWGVVSESIVSRRGVIDRKHIFRAIRANDRYAGVPAKNRAENVAADRRKPENITGFRRVRSDIQPNMGVAMNPEMLAVVNNAPISKVDMPMVSEA